jgi:hypothetical protein
MGASDVSLSGGMWKAWLQCHGIGASMGTCLVAEETMRVVDRMAYIDIRPCGPRARGWLTIHQERGCLAVVFSRGLRGLIASHPNIGDSVLTRYTSLSGWWNRGLSNYLASTFRERRRRG